LGRVVSQGSAAWITHFLPEESQMNIEKHEQTMNALKRIEYKLENLKMEFKATGNPRKHTMDELLSIVDIVKVNMRGKING
jgi:hypothetical protein